MNETMKNLEIAKNNGVGYVYIENTIDDNSDDITILHLNQEQEFVEMPNDLGYAYYREYTYCEGTAVEYFPITDLKRTIDYCVTNNLNIEVCQECLENLSC